MKKIAIVLTLITSMHLIPGASAATMYASDGRTLEVDDSEIEAYRQVNWYYGKPVTMYALDGRTLTVGENDVEMYRQVGWYYGKPVTMYALDGRTLTVGENDVEMYRQVGWYATPMKTLYAPDGRSEAFPESEAAAQLTVGWYEYPVTILYALDGRTAGAPTAEVSAWKSVGWYEAGDTHTMYALDGRSETIPFYEIPAWQKVGWYMVPVQTLYTADGRSAVFPKSEVSAQLTVGWYTSVPYKAAYAEILRNSSTSGASFSLVYIDNDNIPELVYRNGNIHTSQSKVYTFYNGKAVRLKTSEGYDFGTYGSLYFREKNNLFLDYYAGMGISGVGVYKISNGKAVKVCELGTDNSDNPYKVNSRAVSSSTFLNTASKYYLDISNSSGYISTSRYSNAYYANSYKLNSTNIRLLLE